MKIEYVIPHAPHMPGRRESLDRLLLTPRFSPVVFSEKEPHWSWSRKMWRHGLESGADWLVQLQDDVMVPETFTAACEAMLTSVPEGAEVVAMTTIHPLAREVARQGQRWHTTREWLMGNAYALKASFLRELVPWVEKNEALARVTCEDALINRFCVQTGRSVFHCLPSLAEHDLSVPSTWGDQARAMGLDRPEEHGHRQTAVSWRDFSPQEITRPEFWVQQQTVRALLDHLGSKCWLCLGKEPAFCIMSDSGIGIGPGCHGKLAQLAAERMIPK